MKIWKSYQEGERRINIQMSVLEARLFIMGMYVRGFLDRVLKKELKGEAEY